MIDWKKPIECSMGPVRLICVAAAPSGQARVEIFDVVFDVYVNTGMPVRAGIINEDCIIRNKQSSREKASNIVVDFSEIHRPALVMFIDVLIEAGLLKEDE